jgi:rhomboid protease GluP
MNMVGLWVLAPFVEFALGARKFIVVYLVAGVASMGIVMALASGATGLTVGASGGVMGLVGATAALMLRGWLQEKAFSARRRLVAMFAIVVIQTISDAFIPQVSMTAHLSGAVFGFVTTMFVAHRLGVAGGLARTTAPQTETISMPRNSG